MGEWCEWGHVMRDIIKELKILSKGIVTKTVIPHFSNTSEWMRKMLLFQPFSHFIVYLK